MQIKHVWISIHRKLLQRGACMTAICNNWAPGIQIVEEHNPCRHYFESRSSPLNDQFSKSPNLIFKAFRLPSQPRQIFVQHEQPTKRLALQKPARPRRRNRLAALRHGFCILS